MLVHFLSFPSYSPTLAHSGLWNSIIPNYTTHSLKKYLLNAKCVSYGTLRDSYGTITGPRFLTIVMYLPWTRSGVVKVCHWHFYSLLSLLFSTSKSLSAFHLKPWAILCFNFFFAVYRKDMILFIYTNRNTALFTVCCSRHPSICILNFFFSCEIRDGSL